LFVYIILLIFDVSQVRKSLRPELIDTIPSFLLGYLIGSFPTAYLLVMWQARLDIRGAGSGNVGAKNAFDVTGSRVLGISVFLVDCAKGAASAWIGSRLFGQGLLIMGAAGLGAVVGHNYPVWLRFRGGRGLATAAGVMLVMNWMLVVLWCMIWIAVYAYAKNVHGANISASILSPALTLPALRLLPPSPGEGNGHATGLLWLMSMVCLLILLRHRDAFDEFRKKFHKSN
jgi:glycerol-3-phosphate acyltransferase PlsY